MSDSSDRRVLMVLYHFPPLGGVAVPRNVRNVEYLPRFGWTPVVVAPQDAGGLMDPDTLALVPPGTQVIRARCVEPRHLRRIVDPLLDMARIPTLRLHALADLASHGAPSRDGEPGGRGHRLPPARHAPARLWRLHRLLAFPDNQVSWLPFAVLAAIRAHRAKRVDAIYSTSAPVTAHLVAGIVKRVTGVPWVAEFRDPWLGNPIAGALGGRPPWLHRRLQVRLERWIVRSADRLVFVSPSTARLYRGRYPDAAEMVTISNGHDPSETSVRSPEAAAPRRFRIVWTGTLHRPDELQILLEALEALVARRPALVDQLEVVFYGEVSDSCRGVADRFIANGSLGAILSFPGFVPRRVALGALANADAALIMLGAGPGMGQFVPGKLFDYLGQNRQVLAVLPPGDARDILMELGWGVIADPDAKDIEHAIERLLSLPSPARPADPQGKYDRVALTQLLADTLREAAEATHGPSAAQSGPIGNRDQA